MPETTYVVYNRERERRNDAVYAEHKSAVAAGKKRVLRKTSTGELHSYSADEIGFSPGRGQAQVSTWWGMGILIGLLRNHVHWGLLAVPAPLVGGRRAGMGRNVGHWPLGILHPLCVHPRPG